ncbi:MAG: hypothetical protein KBT03_09445 [Bacteroidales bacterium]|nr:hypothetical protein [Candidatus Scybalousia scybalohippi]
MVFTVTSEIKYNDNGLKDVLEACKELSKTLRVGIFGQPEEATKAFNNEFGFITDTGNLVPARSNLYMPLEVCSNDIVESGRKQLKEITKESAKSALNEMGEESLKAINDSFESRGFFTWEDNAQYTIAMKGKDTPLIDTGKLKKSYSYEIVGG